MKTNTRRALWAALSLALATGLSFGAYAPAVHAADTRAPRLARHLGLEPAQAAGNVRTYVVGPLGVVRGMVLSDGTIVLLGGPEVGNRLAQQVAVGQPVRVTGYAPRTNHSKIFHATVVAPSGAVFASDEIPPWVIQVRRTHALRQQWRRHELPRVAHMPPRNVQGNVLAVIECPRGEAHGIVLTDGTTVFFSNEITAQLRARGVTQGEDVVVSGRGTQNSYGVGLVAESVRFSSDNTHAQFPLADVVSDPSLLEE